MVACGDLDVWEGVRRRMGRALPAEALTLPEFASIASDIRTRWSDGALLVDGMSPRVKQICEDFAADSVAIGRAWQREYFCTSGARIGPRAAASLVTIFHWHRGALPLTRQTLLLQC